MDKAEAKVWFGATPPDLTLVARSRQPDWLYTYLRSFYEDDLRPYGVNNRLSQCGHAARADGATRFWRHAPMNLALLQRRQGPMRQHEHGIDRCDVGGPVSMALFTIW